MQTLAGLHRGSVNGGHVTGNTHGVAGNNSVHERVFGSLEGASSLKATPASPVTVDSNVSAAEAASSDAGTVCDLLDHLMHTPAAHPQILTGDAGDFSVSISHEITPERISRFQQLGPPARGPPQSLLRFSV